MHIIPVLLCFDMVTDQFYIYTFYANTTGIGAMPLK